jgi:26S proteasome regulatory subunit N7
MAPYYKYLGETLRVCDVDVQVLEGMMKQNEEELGKLEMAIEDAVKNLGETEVRDAHLAKARFFDRIGDKEAALKNFEETLTKTVGIGQKIDLVFEIMRLGFAWKDTAIIKAYLSKAKE